MNILAIETSSSCLSAAIKKSNHPIREVSSSSYMKHAENLLPAIDRLLKKERLKIKDIDTFLIDRGPGSFTGLRIGFATLKGFLATLPKPCFGAISLDLVASNISTKKSPKFLAVLIDAYRAKLYMRIYQNKNPFWMPKTKLQVVSYETAKDKIPQGCLLAGNGIKKIVSGNLPIAKENFWMPKASTLIKLFENENSAVKKLNHARDFLPFYVRLSEPEEKLAERKKRV